MVREQQVITGIGRMFLNAHQQIGLGGAEVKIVAQSQADDAGFGMDNAACPRVQAVTQFAYDSFHSRAKLLVNIFVPIEYP
jgi:hypothetical protein